MNIVRGPAVMFLLLVVALAAVGCGAPPAAEKQAAEKAVGGAQAAGAEKYASSELAAATDSFKQAERHLKEKKYGEAKTAYLKAKELADKAAAAAQAGKTALASEAQQQAAEIEKRWQELEAKANSMAKRLKPEQVQAWEADARAAAEGLQAAKSASTDDPLAAKEKLAIIVSTIEKWDSELKALPERVKVAKKGEKKK